MANNYLQFSIKTHHMPINGGQRVANFIVLLGVLLAAGGTMVVMCAALGSWYVRSL